MAKNFRAYCQAAMMLVSVLCLGLLATGCATALKAAGAGRGNPLLYALGETAEQLQFGAGGETITTTTVTTTTVPAIASPREAYFVCNAFIYDDQQRIAGVVGKRTAVPITFTPFEEIIFVGERLGHLGKRSTVTVYNSANIKLFENSTVIHGGAHSHYAPFDAGELSNGTYRAFFSLDGVQSGAVEIHVRDPWTAR